jgi:hypothetical protein
MDKIAYNRFIGQDGSNITFDGQDCYWTLDSMDKTANVGFDEFANMMFDRQGC